MYIKCGELSSLTLLYFLGIYKDCRIQFEAILKDYPEKAPEVYMLDTIAHPNIGFMDPHFGWALPRATVCLSTINDWLLNGTFTKNSLSFVTVALQEDFSVLCSALTIN